jgi:hypothetical protein
MNKSIRVNTGFAVAFSVLIFLSGGIAGAFWAARNQKHTYERALQQARERGDRLEEALDRATVDRHHVLREQEGALDKELGTISDKPYRPGPITEYSKIRPLRKNPDLMQLASKYSDPSGDDEFVPQRSVSDYILEKEGPRDDRPVRPPFQMTAEDFEIESVRTNTGMLSYFTEDGVLVDERDVIILEPVAVVGEDGLEALASTAEDVLYFYNEAYDLIYEVDVRHGMNYRRDILGATDEPMEEEENEADKELDAGDGVGEFDQEDFDPRHPV